jgi:hypothetical protein
LHFTELYTTLQNCTNIYTTQHIFTTQNTKSTTIYTHINTCLKKKVHKTTHTQLYTTLHDFTTVCKYLQNCTKIYNILQSFTNLYSIKHNFTPTHNSSQLLRLFFTKTLQINSAKLIKTSSNIKQNCTNTYKSLCNFTKLHTTLEYFYNTLPKHNPLYTKLNKTISNNIPTHLYKKSLQIYTQLLHTLHNCTQFSQQ